VLRAAAAGNFWLLGEVRLDSRLEVGRRGTHLLQEGFGHAFRLLEQSEENVGRLEFRVSIARGDRLPGGECLLHFESEAVRVHEEEYEMSAP
jgi:hypothetical protein